MLAHRLFQRLELVLCESLSLPQILSRNARAVLNEPNPIPGFVNRLMNR